MSRHRITLLMTRPEAGSHGFVAALPDAVTQSCEVVISPLIRIEPLTVDTPDCDAAVFTSAHGVAHAPQALGRRAFCVGNATTDAAAKAGWQAQHSGQDAETLVAALIAAQPQGRLVHFSGTHTRGDVVGHLRAAGLTADSVAVYDQVLLPLTEAAQNRLNGTNPVIVPLFSSRSALHFSQSTVGAAPLYLGAISAAAAANCADVDHVALQIARNPNRVSMIEVVQILLAQVLSA
ncbi:MULTISPECIES: uroporphyrinogen-III synthase [Roseobacteraceae]|uniref:Uroporphyrinogen-III synthase n=1 Tax=Pseudosulfitobacter pseudonitzschiae TaxID=1402135 RepID=A0A221K540_9RHOB|nr:MULTISPECIES: uroporphyrinogen-III synthase [Roseobacteraceae]ASM74000.1 uroporphyrinogen-III synthase [Pseudosulfitobacter pseudonitzschiae]